MFYIPNQRLHFCIWSLLILKVSAKPMILIKTKRILQNRFAFLRLFFRFSYDFNNDGLDDIIGGHDSLYLQLTSENLTKKYFHDTDSPSYDLIFKKNETNININVLIKLSICHVRNKTGLSWEIAHIHTIFIFSVDINLICSHTLFTIYIMNLFVRVVVFSTYIKLQLHHLQFH